MLIIKNLNVSVSDKEVLKDFNLEINDGSIHVIMGPNGSGKTTTIKLILGLQKIDKGKVIINGFDVIRLVMGKLFLMVKILQS